MSLIISIGLTSCKSTKFVPDNKFLLQKYKIKCDNKSISSEDLESYIKQLPNRKIGLLFPMHLSAYNFFNSGKERKWKQKLKKILGEEPVIYDEYLTKKTVKQLNIYMHQKGYYNALVYDTIIKQHNKKLKIQYIIKSNKPYRIKNINYVFEDKKLEPIFLKDSLKSLIKENDILDSDILQNERLRITKMMKNKGFYYFKKEHIYFQIDSALKSNRANVTIWLKNNIKKTADNKLIELNHKKYTIRKISVFTDFDIKESLEKKEKPSIKIVSTTVNNIQFYNNSFNRVIPRIIAESIFININEKYNQSKVTETYKALLKLGQYKLVNIKFIENESSETLDCIIQLSPFTMQSYTLELEGTNTSGNFGIAGNILYKHKSLFKRGEIFDIKFKGAIEAQTSTQKEINGTTQDGLPFNTIEFGSEARIFFPKFLLPIKSIEFIKKYRPKTSISALYNFQQRPDYTRSIINLSFGYFWKTSRYIRHIINPIDLNSVKLFSYSEDFLNSISDPFIKASYTNHFISGTSYSLIYNTQKTNIERDFIYFRFNIESAGSILSSINKILRSPKTNNAYHLFGTQYSQYFKSDIDIRNYNILNKNNKIVSRLFGGFALPYANSDVIPFEKKYFSGGANSIRAWQVRTIGPGSFVDTLNIPNQLGDIKLEANLEYRFKMFWLIEGALFIDIGNVWAINNYDNRDGTTFKLNKFYKELAIGTGFGTRFDFSFFIFRIDIGMKLKDPEYAEGQRWIISNRAYTINDFGFNLGIGYPF